MEVSELRSQVDQALGPNYFRHVANEIHKYTDSVQGMSDTLLTVTDCLANHTGGAIPAEACVAQLSHTGEEGIVEEDVGKALRQLFSTVHDCKVLLCSLLHSPSPVHESIARDSIAEAADCC